MSMSRQLLLVFLLLRLLNRFSMCLDSEKKILVAFVFRSLFKERTGNLLEILFEVCPFLVAVFCRFLFQAKLACFNEKKSKCELSGSQR